MSALASHQVSRATFGKPSSIAFSCADPFIPLRLGGRLGVETARPADIGIEVGGMLPSCTMEN